MLQKFVNMQHTTLTCHAICHNMFWTNRCTEKAMKSCMRHNQLISCMWISPLTSICIPSWFPTIYSEMHKARNLQCFWSVETHFWYKDFVSKNHPKIQGHSRLPGLTTFVTGSYNLCNFGHRMFHSRYGPWWDPNSLWQIPLDFWFWFQSKATESKNTTFPTSHNLPRWSILHPLHQATLSPALGHTKISTDSGRKTSKAAATAEAWVPLKGTSVWVPNSWDKRDKTYKT